MAFEPYQQRIFVCTSSKDEGKSSCDLRGAGEIYEKLRQKVQEAGLKDQIKIVSSGCLGLCQQGPNLIAYPEGNWFSAMTEEDLEAFFNQQIIQGKTYSKKCWDPQELQFFFEEKEKRKKKTVPKKE